MPARTSNAAELVGVFRALGINARSIDATTVEAGGHRFRLAVAAHPTPAEASEIGATADLVLADRLSIAARECLNDAGVGWLDRRGHLRVHRPGLVIDSDLPRLAPPSARWSNTLGETGLDIAVTLLSEPERPWGVNELAHHLHRSQGRVSEILGGLRDQGLVTPATTPLVPEMFWATADQWRPRWMPLSAGPEDADGVRLSGGRAAVALGAGFVLTGDWPLELYFEDAWSLRGLAAEAPSGRVRVAGAACPSPAALRLAPARKHKGFPLAHPVVVALDLAKDRARGREVLESWSPPGYTRVW